MKYRFEVTQTIFKYIDIEAQDEDEAYEAIEKMVGEGEIHFDDEPFLKMECNYTQIPTDSI